MHASQSVQTAERHVIFMKQLKRYALIGIFFVIIAGFPAHFLYEWTGKNRLAGLFTPVNESVWEHMKLLFFPMLLYTIPAVRKLKENYPCAAPSFCFGILAGTALIPILFYAYTSLLGKSILPLDIGIFAVSSLIAFYAAYRLTLSCKLESQTTFLCISVTLLALCFLLFTYHPPDIFLFAKTPVTIHSRCE